ncbi:MAG: polyprenol monophosphomannose synthase [Nitriliruptorales bacterium]
MNRDRAQTLVTIPTFNERDSVEQVVTGVLAAVPDADVLVVDDASPDGTGELVDALARREPRVHVLHRERKLGLGSAYRTGFAWGLARGYEVFVEMDADLSHDPASLPEILRLTTQADLVIGSRYVAGGGTRNWPWHRRALSRGGNVYVRVVTGVPVADATSGYRAFRRSVLETIEVGGLRSEGYSFQLETVLSAWRAGFAIAEVPITFVERRHGASKISRRIVLEAVWRVLVWGLVGPRGPVARHPRSVAEGASAGER